MNYGHGKQVAIVGLGRSGVGAAKLLSTHGAQILVVDDKFENQLEKSLNQIRQLNQVEVELGGITASALINADFIVISPGISLKHPALVQAINRGISVISEVELAYGYCPSKIAAITGTNGKTTTTTLLTQMFLNAGKKAIACGNIGKAFSEVVFELSRDDWAVLEVSSFQLETIREFRSDIAVLLNITPDHLDRHGGMQAYVEAKARLFENQTKQDFSILNVSDKYTPILSSLVRAKLGWFGFPKESKKLDDLGCYVIDDYLELMGSKLISTAEIKLFGSHNLENACAATLSAALAGISREVIAHTLSEFKAVEHRLEDCGEINGVRFINDSKGTNINSVQKAIQSFSQPIVLILGGKDKGGDFRDLIPWFQQKVKRVIAFGEAKNKIVRELSEVITVVEAETLEEVVRGAYASCESPGVVLFSPGCASFDMFENYEDRGRRFKNIVQQLVQFQKKQSIQISTS
jgi:UDP-N-acetylmuramoylalanine--D-glutamate ligase